MKNFWVWVSAGALIISAFANVSMADCASDVNAAAASMADRSIHAFSDPILELMDVVTLNESNYEVAFLITAKGHSAFSEHVKYTVNVQVTGANSCKIINFVEKERS